MAVKDIVNKAKNVVDEQKSKLEKISEGDSKIMSQEQSTEELEQEVLQSGGSTEIQELEREQKQELSEEQSLLERKQEVAELTQQEAQLVEKLEEYLAAEENQTEKEEKDLESKLQRLRNLVENPESISSQDIEGFVQSFAGELEDASQKLRDEVSTEDEIISLLEAESAEISDFESVLEKDLQVIKEEGKITKRAKNIVEKSNSQGLMDQELGLEKIEIREEEEFEEVDLMVVQSIEFLVEVLKEFGEETQRTKQEAEELAQISEQATILMRKLGSKSIDAVDRSQVTVGKLTGVVEEASETAQVALEESQTVLGQVTDLSGKLSETAQSVLQLAEDVAEAGQEGAKTVKNIGETTKNISEIAAELSRQLADAAS